MKHKTSDENKEKEDKKGNTSDVSKNGTCGTEHVSTT